MSIKNRLSNALKSKQYAELANLGLTLVSTDRQINNGSLAFTGKFKVGRRTVQPRYVVTANGAVISNEFVIRQVSNYREGLQVVAELVEKRFNS